MEALKNYLSKIESLSSQEMDFVLSHVKSKKIAKGTALFAPGDLVNSVYFLEEGILHHFNYNESGEQKTLCLHDSPCFCTDLESFSSAIRSQESCVALTECTILEMSKADYNALINTSVKWSNFVKKITELDLIHKLGEIRNITNKSVVERYHDLVTTSPRILQHVSLQIIASYLGTSRETLHRIRRNMRIA